MKLLSRVRLFATLWTVAYQAPPSMGFSRQEYWSGLPFPFPGDLPNPGIEPGSAALQTDALPSEPPGKPKRRCLDQGLLSMASSQIVPESNHPLVKWHSPVPLLVTPWTVAYHAFPSMGFSRQEYWSGLPFPSPEDLSDPGIAPGSLAL